MFWTCFLIYFGTQAGALYAHCKICFGIQAGILEKNFNINFYGINNITKQSLSLV